MSEMTFLALVHPPIFFHCLFCPASLSSYYNRYLMSLPFHPFLSIVILPQHFLNLNFEMLILLLRSLWWSPGSWYDGESTPPPMPLPPNAAVKPAYSWSSCLGTLKSEQQQVDRGRKPDFEVSPLDSEFASFSLLLFVGLNSKQPETQQ